MLENGNSNPYASNINGITSLHVACAKLDWETFEDLIKINGNPLLPSLIMIVTPFCIYFARVESKM